MAVREAASTANGAVANTALVRAVTAREAPVSMDQASTAATNMGVVKVVPGTTDPVAAAVAEVTRLHRDDLSAPGKKEREVTGPGRRAATAAAVPVDLALVAAVIPPEANNSAAVRNARTNARSSTMNGARGWIDDVKASPLTAR